MYVFVVSIAAKLRPNTHQLSSKHDGSTGCTEFIDNPDKKQLTVTYIHIHRSTAVLTNRIELEIFFHNAHCRRR